MRTKNIIRIVLVVLVIAITGIFYFRVASSTPEGAIQKYIILKGNIIEVRKLAIETTSHVDSNLGHQFIVRGYHDRTTGMDVTFFYLKQTSDGCRVESAGTGP
jgi:hypothetical protein